MKSHCLLRFSVAFVALLVLHPQAFAEDQDDPGSRLAARLEAMLSNMRSTHYQAKDPNR